MEQDQKEEIEILESIYPDELELLSETEYIVHLNLDINPPTIIAVEVQYPPTYPETVPILKVCSSERAEELANQQPEENQDTPDIIYDFQEKDFQELNAAAREAAEESVGMPSVFTVVSFVKEKAEELHTERVNALEVERIKELELAEEKEQAKFRGTPVTKESFAEWRKRFRHEMGLDKPKERPNGRMSGREIFESGQATEADDEEEAQE